MYGMYDTDGETPRRLRTPIWDPDSLLWREDFGANHRQTMANTVIGSFLEFVDECTLFVDSGLNSVKDYLEIEFPTDLVVQWGELFLRYLIYIGLMLTTLWLSSKCIQHYLIYPVAEISLFLLPHLGYVIAAAALFLVHFVLRSAAHSSEDTSRALLQIVFILYLLPKVFDAYDTSVREALKHKLQWIRAWNDQGLETAKTYYFEWSVPAPLHVKA